MDILTNTVESRNRQGMNRTLVYVRGAGQIWDDKGDCSTNGTENKFILIEKDEIGSLSHGLYKN